jgi:hypothetical protein
MKAAFDGHDRRNLESLAEVAGDQVKRVFDTAAVKSAIKKILKMARR